MAKYGLRNVSARPRCIPFFLFITVSEIHSEILPWRESCLKQSVDSGRRFADPVLLPRKPEQIERSEEIPTAERSGFHCQITAVFILYAVSFGKRTGKHRPIVVSIVAMNEHQLCSLRRRIFQTIERSPTLLSHRRFALNRKTMEATSIIHPQIIEPPSVQTEIGRAHV